MRDIADQKSALIFKYVSESRDIFKFSFLQLLTHFTLDSI